MDLQSSKACSNPLNRLNKRVIKFILLLGTLTDKSSEQSKFFIHSLLSI